MITIITSVVVPPALKVKKILVMGGRYKLEVLYLDVSYPDGNLTFLAGIHNGAKATDNISG